MLLLDGETSSVMESIHRSRMAGVRFNPKSPSWNIHLKLLTMQNSQNEVPTVVKFVQLTFLPTRLFGIYTRDCNSDNKSLWSIYSLLLFLVISGNSIYSLVYYKDVYPALYDQNALRLCLDRFHFLITNFSGVFCILSAFFSAQRYSAILDSISKVDNVLHDLGLHLEFNYLRSYAQLIVRFVAITVFGILHSSHLLQEKNYGCDVLATSNIIGMVAPLAIVATMEYQHSELLAVVEHRFNAIKERMVEIGTKSPNPSLNELSELESLVKIYNQLNEAAIIINDVYGQQLLFVVGTIFATVTSCANYVVQDVISLITQRKINSSRLLLLNSIWGSYRLLELWFIIAACDGVVEKAKEFSTELYQLMIDDDSLRTSKNKKLYLHISSQKEPTFTAYGFFTLDNSLFHSVIAAATTYIVILIQFSQKTPSSSANGVTGDQPALAASTPNFGPPGDSNSSVPPPFDPKYTLGLHENISSTASY